MTSSSGVFSHDSTKCISLEVAPKIHSGINILSDCAKERSRDEVEEKKKEDEEVEEKEDEEEEMFRIPLCCQASQDNLADEENKQLNTSSER